MPSCCRSGTAINVYRTATRCKLRLSFEGRSSHPRPGPTETVDVITNIRYSFGSLFARQPSLPLDVIVDPPGTGLVCPHNPFVATMRTLSCVLLVILVGGLLSTANAQIVETTDGRVEGTSTSNGIQVFKGIPYAKPPVGDRRWQPPQPVDDWKGVRAADRFGPRCMQARPYGDMVFRSEGMSEDCLYLNVWTPDEAAEEKMPVLVYIYGGGFLAGDGSEPRYDGASMAEKGIVAVTLNYRLGVFGFFAHPALSDESAQGASGNYGLLDQALALQWVHDNVEAFGGDPEQITIAGESAGSMSVSAHMASPHSKGLFARAIGESGAVLGTFPPTPLAEAEREGARFADQINADGLEELRARSATRLLEQATKPSAPRFGLTVDGNFFEQHPRDVYAAGEQAQVPLLLGWNSKESGYEALLGDKAPTPKNYAETVRELYGENADRVLDLYPAATWEQVLQAATDLASDRFMGYSTWTWSEQHRATGAPVYRYYYTHPRPPRKPERGNNVSGLAGETEYRVSPALGAVHAAEIEYVLGNLSTNDLYAWSEEDHRVSDMAQGYFANFIKTGDPNGDDLPSWPATGEDNPPTVMYLDATPEAKDAPHRDRYMLLDQISNE